MLCKQTDSVDIASGCHPTIPTVPWRSSVSAAIPQYQQCHGDLLCQLPSHNTNSAIEIFCVSCHPAIPTMPCRSVSAAIPQYHQCNGNIMCQLPSDNTNSAMEIFCVSCHPAIPSVPYDLLWHLPSHNTNSAMQICVSCHSTIPSVPWKYYVSTAIRQYQKCHGDLLCQLPSRNTISAI